MELLAPVGSKESFVTAIRAGANAVYIGVPDFNARVSAQNITLFDLKVLMDHARQKGVKVFLALNTLIKHEEINDVVKNIAYIEKLEPDAVIVQARLFESSRTTCRRVYRSEATACIGLNWS